MIKIGIIKLLMVAVYLLITTSSYAQNYGKLILRFKAVANNKPLILLDSSYTNAFNETYQLTRLKYYISNVNPSGKVLKQYNNEVFLIETGIVDSLLLTNVLPGIYNKLFFTLGVDSALNNSGAQDGTLDPLNGMFWTWNSGYIFFKMEGYSSASTADLQRIEHHIGGYRYPYNASKVIELDLPKTLKIDEGSIATININVNIDNYWKGINDIKIAEQALLMTPGQLAVKAANNFQNMFSVSSIEQ